DPQQRLLLEVSWEALESSQIVPESLFKSVTGVFLGMSSFEYSHLLKEHYTRTHATEPGRADDKLYTMTGASLSVAAGRLSYTLGLTGPALVVDTACSSSLVAVHQACASLRNQECRVALAGGVHLILSDD